MAVIDELVGILGFDFRGRRDVQQYQNSLRQVDHQLDNVGKRAISVGKLIAAAFVGVATGKAVQSAVSFEEAVADINKVVETTPAQLSALEGELLKMSRRLPVSADGLASIAAEAGAAGVKLEDLTGFTEAVALAVVAFDLPAEKVGETMSKLSNVFGFTVEEMGMFNDTVNHLSNNMAAKAGEILDFTNRAAGAANLLGLTADQLAGVGSALIAAGVVPETAARGLNALATRIQTDAKGVNEALQQVGLSTQQFQEALATDGDAALLDLFSKLSELDISDQATALKALVGQDFSDDFAKFLGNPELLAQGFRLANDEAGKLGSAQAEFAARADTTAAKWERLKGIITSIGIVAAGPLLDGFKAFADFVFKIVEAFDSVEGAANKVQAVLGALGFNASLAEIQNWFDTIAGGFDELKAGISAIFDSIDFNALSGTFTQLADSARSIFGTMVENIQLNFQAVKDGISKIFEAFDLSAVTGAIGELNIVENTVTAISGALNAAGEIFRAAVEVISTAAATLVGNLSDFSEGSVMSSFVDRIGGIFEKVQSIFSGLGEIFANPETQGILTFLGELAGNLLTLFVEVIGNQVITAIDLFVTAIDTIVQVISKLIDGDFAGAFGALFGGIGEILGIVAQSINSIVTSILATLDRIFGFSLVEVFNNIKREFSGFIQDTLNFFVDKINALNEQLPEFVQFDALERFTFADTEEEKSAKALAEQISQIEENSQARIDAIQQEFRSQAVEELGGSGAIRRQAVEDVGPRQGRGDFQHEDRVQARINEIIATAISEYTNEEIQEIENATAESIAALQAAAVPPTAESGSESPGDIQPSPSDSDSLETAIQENTAVQAESGAALNEALAKLQEVQSAPPEPTVSTPAPVRPAVTPTPVAAASHPATVSTPAPIANTQAVENLSGIAASLAGLTAVIQPIAPTLQQLTSAAMAISSMTFAPELIEQTINNDYTKNITNNISNATTVNQTVTGPTAAQQAANAANSGAQRGTNRGLSVNNHGADG